MTPEFQEGLLKFLFQDSKAHKYLDYLDDAAFDDSIHKFIFSVWEEYVRKYSAVPSKANFLEFLTKELKNSKTAAAGISEDTIKSVRRTITDLYSPGAKDTQFVKETIVEYSQLKRLQKLLISSADGIDAADDKFYPTVLREMTKIVRLKEDSDDKDDNRGHLYIAEHNKGKRNKIVAIPTAFKGLDKLTAAKGFYAPQLVVFMKAPKVGGTAFLIILALDFMMQGKKVFYADTENGKESIYERLDMAILECEVSELNGLRSTLRQIKARIGTLGGEFKCVYFPGGRATMGDLDYEITEDFEQTGRKPDIIINDYIDKFEPEDSKIKENRLKIRSVYEHQVRINAKWQAPCFTISPMTSDAAYKFAPKYTDFGEDKTKAYNCHAAFALACTEQEAMNDTCRIIPVAQRQGTKFKNNAATTCALQFDHKRMSIKELDAEVYLSMITQDDDAPKKKVLRKAITSITIKDE